MMKESKGIVWLSSYPKSGNTWFRIFLGHLLALKEGKHIDINEVNTHIHDHISTEKTWVSKEAGFSIDHLSETEIEALLPTLYKRYHQKQTAVTYHKTHRAYTYCNHHPLMPIEACLGVIYFVRNPLDVAVSMTNHFNCSIEEAIKMMGDDDYVLRYFSLPQTMLSWSRHVNSWMSIDSDKIVCLRYEDMLENPLNTFSKAVRFLNIDVSDDLIKIAIQQSSFLNLKKFEESVGFKDKPAYVKSFFRKGMSGDWKESLTSNQIDKIMSDHHEVMKKFGYL